MARTLLDKVWEAHTVRTLPSGQTQLLIGLHLIHEVTTPQAFQMLKDSKLKVRIPSAPSARSTTSSRPTTRRGPTPTPWRRRWRCTWPEHEGFGITLFDMAAASRASCTWSGPSWASPSRA